MAAGVRGRPAAGPPGRPWLVELLAPRAVPVPWGLAAEAAVAVGGSFGIGILSGHTVDGLLVSLGALPAANADRGGPWRLRLRRIAASGVATAAGLVIGAAARGTSWAVVVAACAVAAAAGLISSAGPVASLLGLNLLVYTVIAALDPLPGPSWRTAALALAGAGWTVAIARVGHRSTAPPEQRAVAAAFDAVAATMAAAGSPAATASRQAMTAALNGAEDALVSLRRGLGGPDPDSIALVRALDAAVGLAATATDRVATGRPVGPVGVGAVRDLASLVRVRRRAGPGWASPLLDAGDAELARPLAAAARAVARPPGDDTAEVVVRSRRPAPARERLAAVWDRVAAPRSLAATGRLVLCTAIAEVAATSLGESRPYWIPLTVAVALKPDFGSVFARAVQRALGTAVGVVVGAAILAGIGDRRQLVPVLVVLAALLPVTLVRNYGMFVTVLTPLVLVQIDALVPAPGQLVTARLLDTLLGCGITLVVGFAVWPSTWRPRLTTDLAAGVGAVGAYLRAPGDTTHRRAAYRRLSDLRTTWSQHFADPSPTGAQARALWPAVIALEQVLDRAVALHAAAHRHTRRTPPQPEEERHPDLAGRLARAADELAAAAEGRPATAGEGPSGDEELDDLIGEVAAAVARAGAGRRATRGGQRRLARVGGRLLSRGRRPGPPARRRRARRGRGDPPRR